MSNEDAGLSPQQVRTLADTLYDKGEISQAQRDRASRRAAEPNFARMLDKALKEERGEARSEELERVLGPRGVLPASAPPASTAVKKSLPEYFIAGISHYELWLPFILITAWSVTSAFPIPAFQAPIFQASLMLALGVSIVYLILASFKQVTGKVDALSTDIDRRITMVQKQYYRDRHDIMASLYDVHANLREPEAPMIANFNSALPRMKEAVIERLQAGQNVRIRVLGISAQFSWRNLIDDGMDEYLKAIVAPGQTITIAILVVSSDVLERWGQDRLKTSRETFDKDLARFRRRHKAREDSGQLNLSVSEYGNMPHWHGIMIDGDLLFMGRTRWKAEGSDRELTVGQNPYRQFTINDRFRGSEWIEEFENWFEAYERQLES